MAKVTKRTFSLPEDQSAFIDAKVAAGGYTSSSEVVREGLRVLQAREAEIDRWMIEEVIPTYDRWKAGLEKTYTAEEVLAEVRASIKESAARKAS